MFVTSLRYKAPIIWFVLYGAVFSSSSMAHHGTFTFDGSKVITLEGRVVDFRWTNPHSTLVMDVVSADGSQQRYMVEGDGPSILGPLGVTRESLKAGDQVIVYASPSQRENAPTVLGREVIRADGTVVGLSVAYTRRMEQQSLPAADSVLGTWVSDQDALFALVQSRSDWSLTQAGSASLASYDLAAPFSQTACIPVTSPTLLMYPTARMLSNRGDHIEMQIDWMGASRTLYTDGRGHPESEVRFLQGHSVARFEDRALVIETTNFTDNPMGNIFGIASGPDKKLIEKLELAENGRSLTYHFTLSDPEYLAAPVTDSYTWHYRPDVQLSTVACNPEEASRHLRE